MYSPDTQLKDLAEAVLDFLNTGDLIICLDKQESKKRGLVLSIAPLLQLMKA